MLGCSNRYRPIFHAAVVTGVVLLLGWSEATAQSYPFPKPKPQVPGAANAEFPLPRPNPRRPAETPRDASNAKSPEQTTKRPADPRAAESTGPDTGEPLSGEWPKTEIAEARKACRDLLKDLPITYEEVEPIGGPGECGVAAPIKVTALGGPKSPVRIEPPAILNCTLTAAAARWMHSKVQIAALAVYGERVVGITNVSAYVCRRRNNSKSGKLSEHALGNALDVAAFTLASGKVITVLHGWRGGKKETLVEEVVSKAFTPETPDSRFLSQAHKGACDVFSTILGPEADKHHVDHFHLDLGRGGRYLICH